MRFNSYFERNTIFPTLSAASRRVAGTLLLGCVLMLAACTALKLTYNNGQTLVYWWLNSYVDIDSEDKSFVNERIGQFFSWHRSRELPEYAKRLRIIADQVGSSQLISPQDVAGWIGALRNMGHRVARHEMPALAALALRLTPEQVENIAARLHKNDEKFRKERLAVGQQEQKQFRYRQALKNAEQWLGSLSAEQQMQLRAWSDVRPLENAVLLQERQRKQGALLEVLRKIVRERPDQVVAEKLLAPLIDEAIDNIPGPENAEFVRISEASAYDLTAKMIGIATPAQRALAAERIRKTAADLDELSHQAVAPG